MATYGKINEFDPENDKIGVYLERVDLFMEANELAGEKGVPVFLSLIGGRAYSLLRDLVAPENPKSKSLDQLKKLLKDHYEPKPLTIAE